MAWGKYFKLVIGNGSGEDPGDSFIDCTGLDISFRIYRSNIFSASKAEFTIWNPSVPTMEKFMQAENSDVNVWAGYDDEGNSLIYAGHVLDAHPEWEGSDLKMVILATPIRATGFSANDNKGIYAESALRPRLVKQLNDAQVALGIAESVTVAPGTPTEEAKAIRKAKAVSTFNAKAEIKAAQEAIKNIDESAAQSISAAALMSYVIAKETLRVSANTYLNIAFAQNTLLKDLIIAVATSINIPVVGLEPITMKMTNGYNASYTMKHVLRDIANKLRAEGYEMFIDLKEWVIYNALDRTINEKLAFLSKDSGLLGVAPAKIYEYDKQRPEVLPPAKIFELRSILNPMIRPNAIVDVDSTDMEGVTPIKGLYLVESVEFVGDTMGGAFLANVVVSEARTQSSVSLITSDVALNTSQATV